jgi:hypothetical protein
MNDPTPTPDNDDLIRRALQSEAEGVQASDELLDRTMGAVRRPPVRTGRRLLAAAAIVAAVAIGVGVAVTRDDGEHPVESAGDPGTTTPTAPPETEGLLEALGVLYPCRDGDVVRLSLMVDGPDATAVYTALQSDDRARDLTAASSEDVAVALGIPLGSVPADDVPSAFSASFANAEDELAVRGAVADLPGVLATSSSNCDQGGPVTPGDPTLIAMVREDGWLVVIDLETGEERELHFGGDPEAPPSGQEEGGPQFIDAVDLSPDLQWVYFSTCCEPASGVTFRISVDGGEPEPVASGAYPRVSPDGRSVATADGIGVVVTPLDGSGDPVRADTSCCAHGLAWSPDGRQLAGVHSAGTDRPQVILFDWDGTSLTPADPGKPDNPGIFVAWAPDGVMTTVSGGGSVDSSRSLSQDASYEWLLWVDSEGVMREQAGLSSGELPAIPGVPEALTADW